MPKYPINVTPFIKAIEEENGGPLDKTSRDLWSLIVKLQNRAYDAGLKDGFMKQCESITKPTMPSVKAVKLIDPKLDKQLTGALKSLREGLDEAFEKEGFDSVVKALGVLPQDTPWGERIYAIARESFFQGGLYTALANDEEEENDDRD